MDDDNNNSEPSQVPVIYLGRDAYPLNERTSPNRNQIDVVLYRHVLYWSTTYSMTGEEITIEL